MAGYSGTPLPKKLGIKERSRVATLGAPPGFERTLGKLPEGARIQRELGDAKGFDVIVWFVTSQRDLRERFASLARRMDRAGGLWVAWPKRASGVATDMTEDRVREV